VSSPTIPTSARPNATSRFAGDGAPAAAWGAWVTAGVSHLSAASPGHHGAAVAAVAGHIGVGCLQVAGLLKTTLDLGLESKPEGTV
jgi:hypothetical protein